MPSLLDLILTDDENTVSTVTSLPPLDHIVIEFDYLTVQLNAIMFLNIYTAAEITHQSLGIY